MTVRLQREADALMTNLKLARYEFEIFDGDVKVGVRSFTPVTGKTAKAGCEILPEHRDKDYASDSLALLIEWAWGQGFETLITGVAESNKASQIVLFKNGFRVDFITTEPDDRYYQVRLERQWSFDMHEHWYTEIPMDDARG